MAIRAVLAIGPTLWLFGDRMASTHMGEPLTWDEILNLDSDSGGRSMATDFRRRLAVTICCAATERIATCCGL